MTKIHGNDLVMQFLHILADYDPQVVEIVPVWSLFKSVDPGEDEGPTSMFREALGSLLGVRTADAINRLPKMARDEIIKDLVVTYTPDIGKINAVTGQADGDLAVTLMYYAKALGHLQPLGHTCLSRMQATLDEYYDVISC